MEQQSIVNKALEKIGDFSASEFNMIHAHAQFRQLKKNDILLKEGQVCSAIYFIIKGAFYQYRMNDVDENIIELHVDNEWFLNNTSFITQKPSFDTIKAYADSEILELNIHSIHKLIEISPVFFQLGKLLQPAAVRTQFFDNTMTPAEKYNYVLEHRPRLLQSFPLKYIASYLKMAPETLSRIRGKH
ncbi:Crp/Fnr family transcriptional regulator [Olivibacter sitiensis]|uniref:Crp/Fnr family transcriptional regulator n=1 Tax=Olivibacter sitiensis TaxID=376470 RepID=UPI00041B69F3|nr:Crp/Fnr family transcriptional regulator [Olivibacter sitiensis]